MQFTSLGNWFTSLPDTLSSYGVDGQALLTELGVNSQPDRIPTQLTAHAWHLAATRTGNPAIALQAARQIRPADWGPLGLAVQHSHNLAEAIALCLRHSSYISNSVSLLWQPHALGMELVVRPLSGHLPGHESMEFGMAAGHSILQQSLGRPLPLATLAQTRPRPADVAPWRAQFHCQHVEFGAEYGSQVYTAELLETPFPLADTQARNHYVQQLQASPALALPDPWLANVEQQILRGLTQGQCDQKTVAEALDISPRHLQRQFKQRQLRFTQLVDELRAAQATRLLAADRSLNDIALQLGFSDHSNFSRAFRRWYGVSPSTYRGRDTK